MNNLIRSLFLAVALVWTHGAFAQASITLIGPPSSNYTAPANFDLQASYYVSTGPKAEFIEDPVVSQNGVAIARLLEGTVPLRGLPPGRYEFIFTGRAVRILPDGDMVSRPLRSGPIIVEVTAPPVPVDAASPGATSYPNPSLVGRPSVVSIQMINTGETTWGAGSYFLDTPHDFTRDFWKFSPQPVTQDIPPGTSFTFTFEVTPSYYDQHVEWRNIEFQLRRNQNWFGLKTYTSIFVREPMNAAAFESQSVPAHMEAGKSYEVVIRMRNAGDDPWRSQDGFALGSQNPDDNMTWGIHRIRTSDVSVGSVGELRANVTAPSAAGTYSFQWRMLREGVEWFGVATPNVQISVTEPPPPPPPALVGTTYLYDALGREIGTSTDSELGPLVTATAYLPGNRVARENARGEVTTTSYQAFDTPGQEHALKIEEPEGRVTHIDRDRFAAIHRIAREVGTGAIERNYVYDAHHRLCKSVEPESGTTAMGYDPAGRLLWKANGLSLPSLKTCDSDAARASHRTISHSYDANGRLSAISSPDGLGNQTFQYAPDGLVLEATASNGEALADSVTRMRYNSRRMITSETSSLSGQADWTSSYRYDASGSLIKHTFPSGLELDYAPDALGRPRHIVDQRGRVFAGDIKRHASGAVAEFTYGNGIAHRMAQNLRQLPSRISAGAAMDFEYAYDENGNVRSIVDHAQGPSADRRMAYDGIDRLTAVQSQLPDIGQRFGYDQADNLLWIETTGQPKRHHYFDGHHRLTNVRDDAGCTIMGLAYDSAGNVSRRNGVAYSFDLQNRLRSLGTDISYAYDAKGRRVQLDSRSGTSQSRYMYLGSGEMSRSLDGMSRTLTENIYLDGDVIASIKTSAEGTESIEFHHSDSLGTRVATSVGGGALLRRTNYRAYGGSDQAASGSIGYTGHIEDADGDLIYMQQRYYSADIGRFISTDAVSPIEIDDARHVNRYAYAYSNPTTFPDPDGRCPVCIGAGIGAGIGFGIEAGAQLFTKGKVDNWTAVWISTGAGAVTGGAGAIAGRAAIAGTTTAMKAVKATATVGGAASATGKVSEAQITGNSVSSKEVAVSALTGMAGSGTGAKIGLSVTGRLEAMAAGGGISGHIGRTTQNAVQQGGKISAGSASFTQVTTDFAAGAAASFAEKKVNNP